ncbi:DeoR family transcriptional regulator [Alteromonas pelagimontana]|uniref:DeoR family transcriptional regulator n=1 Tax=Alteromonas pelagimontana TaxID=1858656 RepID=A0A6M4MCI1_9ALTE|nr:DeoR family transcriptional regulator [Alteromonas pelagimontana]QJR80747.1 DeoR family transcriptional regulator [Alteromonas pelagimontana]
MQKRNTQQRRRDIVDWVNEHGHVQVDELAGEFHTSEVTIRKDLAFLAGQNLLLRQFGGAAPIPGHHIEAGSNISEQKNGIGKIAASLVSNGQKIILDCGSTTSAILPFLSNYSKLVIMTNSLHAANVLTAGDNEPTVLMTGGTWDAQSQSFQGHMAEKMIAAYSFDLAFIGAAGIDVTRGTTTFNELTGLTRAMAKAAKRVVIMAESNKLSHKMPNLELAWENISVLVTDSSIDESVKYNIEQQGVQVLITAPNGEELCAE